MMSTVFVIPNTQLPTDIRIQVVVGQGSHQPGVEVIQKSLLCEVVIPGEAR